jgi:acetyl esterase/lipase
MTRRGGRILAAVAVLATLAMVPSRASAAGQRYLDQVFTAVTITSDVEYGTATDCLGNLQHLLLDVYQPVGDTETKRPLFLWIHGGFFAWGDKADDLEERIATDFAERGYVTASINYRLCDTLNNQTMLDAYDDARTAVAYLRANASTYGIDPDRIAISGASAGAISALNVAYIPDRSAGEGTATDPARVEAVLSMAGTGRSLRIETGEPPAFMAHGENDDIIPFASARAFCDALLAKSVRCDFHGYPTGHESLVNALADIETNSFAFLYDVLALAPPPTTTTTAPTTTTTAPPSTPTTASPTAAALAQPVSAVPAFTG